MGESGTRKKSVWREAAFVLLAGTVFGLLANTISPHGLRLGHDYFPKASESISTSSVALRAPSDLQGKTNEAEDRLRQKGLLPISADEVQALIQDPRYEVDSIILVDARDDRHYQEGHIPGAFQFDRYYPEKYLPVLLPVAMSAERIVVYCNGGTCEDSEFAAATLREAGIPNEKLQVFAGGITAWRTKLLPTEIGERKSGNLKQSLPEER